MLSTILAYWEISILQVDNKAMPSTQQLSARATPQSNSAKGMTQTFNGNTLKNSFPPAPSLHRPLAPLGPPVYAKQNIESRGPLGLPLLPQKMKAKNGSRLAQTSAPHQLKPQPPINLSNRVEWVLQLPKAWEDIIILVIITCADLLL